VLRTRWPDVRATHRNTNGDHATALLVVGEQRAPNAALSLARAVRGTVRSLLPWRPYPPVLVIELAARAPSDLGRATRWLRPHVAVLTNVRDAHLALYPSPEALAGEKCWPLRRLRPGGVAVLNAADPTCVRVGPLLDRVVWIGDDLRVESARSSEGWTSATVVASGERHDVRLPLSGAHQLDAVLIAVAVGSVAGIAASDALAACAGVGSLPGRGKVSRSADGQVWVLDESGGTSPWALRTALETLRTTLPPPHVAVLTGMYEIGPDDAAVHHEIAASLVPWLDRLIAVGDAARALAAGALEAGMSPDRVEVARDPDEALEIVRRLEPPASVLVKGTTYLQPIVVELTAADVWERRRRPRRLATD
jgi:UDP-N-acetylmuramoyl-tripeptide--D-alanyl-D-alanine ligase